jgi:hypothetical protein
VLGHDDGNLVNSVQIIDEGGVGEAAVWWANALRQLFISVVHLPQPQYDTPELYITDNGDLQFEGMSYDPSQLDTLLVKLRAALK